MCGASLLCPLPTALEAQVPEVFQNPPCLRVGAGGFIGDSIGAELGGHVNQLPNRRHNTNL